MFPALRSAILISSCTLRKEHHRVLDPSPFHLAEQAILSAGGPPVPLGLRRALKPGVRLRLAASPALRTTSRDLKPTKDENTQESALNMTRTIPAHADYYQILGIPFTTSSAALSKQQIKLAYHRALLKHHPDKAGAVAQDAGIKGRASRDEVFSRSDNQAVDQRAYTIDEITTAYKTLCDPALRAEYDRTLRLDRLKVAEREKTGDVFHAGLEIVDLEDLACEEDGEHGACWYRGCRCGDEKGFLVTEDDLEREADHGEIVVGCRGCSLWLKVLFAVEDDG